MRYIANIFIDLLHIAKFWILADLFLALEMRKPKKYLYAIGLTVLCSTMIFLSDNFVIKACLYVLLVAINYGMIYDIKIRRICGFTVWSVFMMAIIDQISTNFVEALGILAGIDSEKSIKSILIQITTLIFLWVVGRLVQRKHPQGMADLPYTYIAFFSIVTLTDSIILVLLGDFVVKEMNRGSYLISGVAYILIAAGIFFQVGMMIMLFLSINEHIEREEQAKQFLEEQKNHYLYLEQRETETKKFRHDIRNHLLLLDSLMRNGDWDGAKEYLNQINENMEAIGNQISVNNGIVDTVLNQCAYYAGKNQINLLVKGYFPRECTIRAFDLCTILSNLLNNAIEAEIRAKGSQVEVYFKHMGEHVVIDIKNHSDSPVGKNGQFETTKPDKNRHGFGLANVRKCIKKNEGDMYFQQDGDEFMVRILLKCSEAKYENCNRR